MPRRLWRLSPRACRIPNRTDLPPPMLARISQLISRGVIDNTVKELIDLRLWCIDGKEPLHLRMSGNCLGDIAGCRVEFRNNAAASVTEAAMESAAEVFRLLREAAATPGAIIAGDITCSERRRAEGDSPLLLNHLYIEFFVGTQTRFLAQMHHFYYSLSLPQWEITWAEIRAQEYMNADALRQHVDYVVKHFCGPSLHECERGFPVDELDHVMNAAEAGMAVYPTVYEKYRYRRDGGVTTAYVMGRTDYLHLLASREENNMPPPDDLNRKWEVVDFLDAKRNKMIRKAMRNPLFRSLSATATKLRSSIEKLRRTEPDKLDEKEVGHYVGLFASIISNALTSIVLTEQPSFSSEIVLRRLAFLEERTRRMKELADKFSPDCTYLFREASISVLNALRLFSDLVRMR